MRSSICVPMIIRTGCKLSLQLHSSEKLVDSCVEPIDVLTPSRSEVGLTATTALNMLSSRAEELGGIPAS